MKRCARDLLSSLARILVLVSAPQPGAGVPLFDTHIHYDASVAARLPPAEVIEILDRNGVTCAAVAGMPPEQGLALYRAAPERIVPFLGAYRQPADKETWHQDAGLPARLQARMNDAPRGWHRRAAYLRRTQVQPGFSAYRGTRA